jgi:serine/threonine protein kinase
MLTYSYTMAPEVLKGKYTKQADVWSIGVIAYMLLSSQMPFYGRHRRHIVEQIMKGEFQFKGRRWKRVSAQSREFIRDLLVLDPEERLDAESALRSSWLNKRFNATVRSPFEEELESAKQSILNYTNYNKLKRVALMVIAHKSTSDEIGILRKIFEKYDTQRDGYLDHDEFQAAIADCGFSQEHALEIFDAVVRASKVIIKRHSGFAAVSSCFATLTSASILSSPLLVLYRIWTERGRLNIPNSWLPRLKRMEPLANKSWRKRLIASMPTTRVLYLLRISEKFWVTTFRRRKLMPL